MTTPQALAALHMNSLTRQIRECVRRAEAAEHLEHAELWRDRAADLQEHLATARTVGLILGVKSKPGGTQEG